MRKGFSIIEVLFAVAFLIMVGLAMMALNAAALKLINGAELQTVANTLNEETVAVVAIAKKTNPAGFSNLITSLNCDQNCYVDCSADDLQQTCTLANESKPIQLGRNKLQFVRTVTITPTGTADAYTVLATVRWGTGSNRVSTLTEVID